MSQERKNRAEAHSRRHEGAQGEGQELSARERLFVESQNQCALCNSPLEIKVESYLENYFLREEAVCPVCNIKTRVKNHKIQ